MNLYHLGDWMWMFWTRKEDNWSLPWAWLAVAIYALINALS